MVGRRVIGSILRSDVRHFFGIKCMGIVEESEDIISNKIKGNIMETKEGVM